MAVARPTRGRPPSIEELDRLPADACVEALAPLFEGAPRFLARLCAERPFGDAEALFERAERLAFELPEADQVELLDAHPRLGAAPAGVSALSFREQGYGRGLPDGAVAAELERLNAAYERRFGFRYCVFVAGRSHAEIVPGLRAALTAGRADELRRGLGDVVAIARDRYRRARP